MLPYVCGNRKLNLCWDINMRLWRRCCVWEWRGQEMSVVVSTREKRSSWSWFIVHVACAVFCSQAPSLKLRHRSTSHLLTKSSFATQHISVERNLWYSIVLFLMEKNTDGSVQHYPSFGPNKFQIKKVAMRLVAKMYDLIYWPWLVPYFSLFSSKLASVLFVLFGVCFFVALH